MAFEPVETVARVAGDALVVLANRKRRGQTRVGAAARV
jgi:hypothetical protein